VLQVRIIYTYIYTLIATWYFPYTPLGLYELNTTLTNPTHVCKFICWPNSILKTLFKSYCNCNGKPTALMPAVAEPPELFRLKCVNDHRTTAISLTHFKQNNPLVCRVSAQYNHGSTGSKQVYLARRRVYNHRRAHQLLIYSHTYIITNRVQKQLNLYKQCSNWQV
jgi:hypothetical protein